MFTRAYNFSITNNLITPAFVEWQIICSPWFLCSVKHSNISWSSSGYFGVKWPIVVRFAYTFSSPLKSLAWSLRRTMDSISPYSRAISQLFSTASASATTLSGKAILYDKWRVFGMMNIVRNRWIIDFGKQLFVARSHSIDQLGSISIHDRTGWLNVSNKQIAFLKDVIFLFYFACLLIWHNNFRHVSWVEHFLEWLSGHSIELFCETEVSAYGRDFSNFFLESLRPLSCLLSLGSRLVAKLGLQIIKCGNRPNICWCDSTVSNHQLRTLIDAFRFRLLKVVFSSTQK